MIIKTKRLLLIFFLLTANVGIAQRTLEFRISTVSSNGGDLDGFGAGDSDYQWDFSMTDGVNTGSNSFEQSGTNCPGLRTINNTFFSQSYDCAIPNMTFTWRGFEDDGVGSDANTGLRTVNIVGTTPTSSAFVNLNTYTAVALGASAAPCPTPGGVTYTITLQYRVAGAISAFATPASVTSSNNNPTTGTNITLTQTGGNALAGNFSWYSSSCGGTLLGTGTSINVAFTTPTTYFVRANRPFCPITCASITLPFVPLPITLLNFEGKCRNTLDDNIIELNWCTNTEINNEYFTLEQSSVTSDK